MQKISAALVAAQKAFGPALKTSTNPHFKTQYVNLAGCVEAVIDALNNHGIMLMQPARECADGVMIETLFLHESGEEKSGGVFHVPASKQDAQGYGSAMTYARRYGLMSACGIAPEDDDGNAASAPRRPPEKPLDMSPGARAKRIAEGCASGDAAGAAQAMAGWDKPTLDAVWVLLNPETQQSLNAAWPQG